MVNRRHTRPDALDTAILAFVKQSGKAEVPDIIEHTRRNGNTVRYRLKTLEEIGFLDSEDVLGGYKRRLFSITDKGDEVHDD
ncbi:MAG: hypothetical protein PWP08_892 [Methanofollis sp.]|nr:hypothetical protein [Methanofollis sp.]